MTDTADVESPEQLDAGAADPDGPMTGDELHRRYVAWKALPEAEQPAAGTAILDELGIEVRHTPDGGKVFTMPNGTTDETRQRAEYAAKRLAEICQPLDTSNRIRSRQRNGVWQVVYTPVVVHSASRPTHVVTAPTSGTRQRATRRPRRKASARAGPDDSDPPGAGDHAEHPLTRVDWPSLTADQLADLRAVLLPAVRRIRRERSR